MQADDTQLKSRIDANYANGRALYENTPAKINFY